MSWVSLHMVQPYNNTFGSLYIVQFQITDFARFFYVLDM